MHPTTFERGTRSDTGGVLLVGEGLSGLASALEAELAGVRVTVEPDSTVGLVRATGNREVGCVVVDHRPPDHDGIAFLRALHESRSDLPCLVRVADGDDVDAVLSAGAADVVDADDPNAAALAARRVRAALAARNGRDGVPTSTLARLVEASREFAAVDSPTDAADCCARTVESLLPGADATVYLFDETAGVLRPATDDRRDPVGPDSNSPVWEAYAATEGPLGVADAGQGAPSVLSLGGYGALAVDDADWDEGTAGLVSLVAADAAGALARLDREARLADGAWERKRQANRIDTLRRTMGALLDAESAVTHADTREELESTVCEALASPERFGFVWLGALSDDGTRLIPRTWAGEERGYFDRVDLSLSSGCDPAVRAAREREPVYVRDVTDRAGEDAWRHELLDRGHHAVLALPLVHNGSLYGVLTVCAGAFTPFDEVTTRTCSAVADSLAYGIDAMERKRALATDSSVELELRIRDPDDVLNRLADQVGGEVEFESVVTGADGSTTVYVSLSDPPSSEMVAELRESLAVEDVTAVAADDRRDVLAVRAADPTLVSTVADAGAVVRTLTASATETRLTLELPRPSSVREFFDRLGGQYEEVELLAQRTHDRPVESRQTLLARLSETLTERQQEVLETAYQNGYFEWPRARTGEQVAALLGITQPTFNNHLRVAERKLFTLLFDADDADQHT